MVRTLSNMLELGAQAPAFTLPDVNGGAYAFPGSAPSPKGSLILFICNHCPFVKHVDAELRALAADYLPQGIEIIAISSNDVEHYPDDSPEKMAELALPFPYLYDESQQVAKDYKAACTPDVYLFDADRKLVYRGQIDDSRPKTDIPVTGRDLRAALDALLAGRPVDPDQRPSVGCNIKWKPGNEPEWFGGA